MLIDKSAGGEVCCPLVATRMTAAARVELEGPGELAPCPDFREGSSEAISLAGGLFYFATEVLKSTFS